jgi:UDP-N-acetylglucosamine acyltransferase
MMGIGFWNAVRLRDRDQQEQISAGKARMNKIHSTVIIDGDVTFGDGNQILPNTILIGPLCIGDNNIIGPNVVIGTPGQDTKKPRYDASGKKIKIGNDNIIREFTAIQKPAYEELTTVGNSVFIMQSVHIPHDAWIEDYVTITPMVALGGITRVLEGATISIGCSVHQFSVIGQYAIVGMGAAVLKNVKPFSRHIPGKPATVNNYAIDKFNYSELSDEISAYVLDGSMPKSHRLKRIVKHFEKLHKCSGREIYS